MDESPPTPAMADPSEVVWSHAEDVAQTSLLGADAGPSTAWSRVPVSMDLGCWSEPGLSPGLTGPP